MNKKLPMTKERIEKMCRRAGMRPVERRTCHGVDVVVADGFTATPHVTFQKFNVEKGDFPYGCYGTFWWALRGGDDRFMVAYPLFFDAFHNPELDTASKAAARVEAAFENAREFLETCRDTILDALPTLH